MVQFAMHCFGTSASHVCLYQLISSRFGCLRKLDVLSTQEILLAESTLVEVYKDVHDVSLRNELGQFADFVITFKDEQAEEVSRLFLVTADTQGARSGIIS